MTELKKLRNMKLIVIQKVVGALGTKKSLSNLKSEEQIDTI